MQSQRLSCIEKKCFSFLKHVFEFWPLPSFSLLRKFSNFILMIFLTLKGRGGHNAPPPDFKTSLFQKTSPLTYPENSWLFLQRSRKLFAKVLGCEISCLNAWREPECLGWPKTSEYNQITRLYVLIRTLNQKMSGEKKFNISQGYRFKIWNQSQKKSAWKRPIFLGHPDSDSCVKNSQTFFIKYFSVYKILVPWKNQPLPITTSRDNRGGGP